MFTVRDILEEDMNHGKVKLTVNSYFNIFILNSEFFLLSGFWLPSFSEDFRALANDMSNYAFRNAS